MGCITVTIGLPEPGWLSLVLNICTAGALTSAQKKPPGSWQQLSVDCRLPIPGVTKENHAAFDPDEILAKDRNAAGPKVDAVAPGFQRARRRESEMNFVRCRAKKRGQ